MTYHSMYVGNLRGFRWEDGNWNGNIPAGLTSAFPPLPSHYPYHRAFFAWVERSGVFHAQTDFDAHVARVTKAQILDFLEFCYGTDCWYRDGTSRPDLLTRLEKLEQEVAALDDGVEYGLVSECF